MYDSIIETTARQRIRERITDTERQCAVHDAGRRRRTSRQDVAARIKKYGDRLES